MTRLKGLAAALLGLTLATTAAAQTHDLSLEIIVDALPVTPPGSTGTVTFIVTNNGPDTAGVPAGLPPRVLIAAKKMNFTYAHGDFIFYDQISDPADCVLTSGLASPLPGEPIPVLYTWNLFEIPAGTSVTCMATFMINPFAEIIDPEETADGIITHSWVVGSTRGTDPNPDNNRTAINYQLVAPPIPTLSPVGLTALTIGILLAFGALRRRHCCL